MCLDYVSKLFGSKMIENADLNNLVSDVLNENRYKHCRLCLMDLKEQYVRFEDTVSLYVDGTSYDSFSNIINKLLGSEICDDIPGIDAVCIDCVNKALEAARFIEQCENSCKLLNNVIDNLSETLNIDIDVRNKEQSLYVLVSESDSQLIVVNNDNVKNSPADDKQYSCPVREVIFEELDIFRDHCLSNHELYMCMKCEEILTDDRELQEHLNSCEIYKCEKCSLSICTEESLKNHKYKIHKIFVCKDCGKSFRGVAKLQAHEQKHVVTKNQCPKCGKSYTTKEFFQKHVKLCLENMLDPHPIRNKIKKTFFCSECGKGYSTPGGLRVHQRFVHGNAEPHTCKYCNKQFTAPSYLKSHMVKHTGEKNFKCDICNGKFVSKEALLYHTRRHTGEKPYSCTQCNEKFVNASSRAEHIKFKHVGPTLMCEICSKKFVTPNFLRLHMKKHEDRTNKLYSGRCTIPPNMPGIENMRVKL